MMLSECLGSFSQLADTSTLMENMQKTIAYWREIERECVYVCDCLTVLVDSPSSLATTNSIMMGTPAATFQTGYSPTSLGAWQ